MDQALGEEGLPFDSPLCVLPHCSLEDFPEGAVAVGVGGEEGVEGLDGVDGVDGVEGAEGLEGTEGTESAEGTEGEADAIVS